jgi:nucleotide-binding universal stress UspA family protein
MIGDTIIVGIDGSPGSEHALDWAIAEAQRSGRPLSIVHVWHWSTDAVAIPMSLVGAPDTRKAGRALLVRAANHARRHGVATTVRLLEGSPSRQLIKAAEQCAMLVVGSHGYRSLTSMLLGSVSRSCLQHAHCPVVVIPPEAPVPAPNHLSATPT